MQKTYKTSTVLNVSILLLPLASFIMNIGVTFPKVTKVLQTLLLVQRDYEGVQAKKIVCMSMNWLI